MLCRRHSNPLRCPRRTPIGALARGVVAGAAGTLAMDALMYARYRKGGGTDRFVDWEFSADLDNWDDAPAPAQIGRRVVEGVFQVDLSPSWARLTNNVTHWGYGVAWGAQYGLGAGSVRRPRARYGLVLGPVVWLSGYVVLPLAKLYKPIWEYDEATLAKDMSAHLVYGAVTGAVFRVLAGSRSAPSET